MLSGPALIPSHPQTAVVLFHGYGSNGDDLITLGEEWASTLPNTAFWAPNAPTPVWSDGFEWFSLSDYQSVDMITPDYLRQLNTRAATVISDVSAYLNHISQTYQIPLSHFILGGFSQGGLIAFQTAFALPESIQALIGMSAVPLTDPIQTTKRLNILLTHGKQDDVVPIEAMYLSKQTFELMNQSVNTLIRPRMGHGIDATCALAVQQFIHQQINRSSNTSLFS